MKATTADFLQATDAQKEQLLIDGIAYINETLKNASDNAMRLNTWLKCFNSLARIGEIKPSNIDQFKEKIIEFTQRLDDFTDHTMVTSMQTNFTINKILTQ
jgi:hypothetical protein